MLLGSWLYQSLLTVNYGCGQVEEQSKIATPHFRGHVMKRSIQALESLMKPKHPSKGCKKSHNPAMKPANGQAMKNNRMAHNKEKQGLPFMIDSDQKKINNAYKRSLEGTAL
jgi:hypothetical protein